MRWATSPGCSDGDLDGFARAYLHQGEGRRSAGPPAARRHPGPGAPSTQPAAPYLEAVTAYGFRGSTRFHVPGHKGGDGADPGLRRALGERALLLDVPQDIEGIDLGPSPTPYELAEQLAADAYGANARGFSPTARHRATTPSAWPSPRPGPGSSSSATRTPASSTA